MVTLQLDEKLIEGLTKIGLQRYQAQVYIASVTIGDATAYQIAKESGVPRAKVYSVLDSLVEMGYIAKVPIEKGTMFRALPPEETIGNAISELVSIVEEVKREIELLRESKLKEPEEPPVMMFKNVDSVLTMIKNGEFTDAWIDNKLPFAGELRAILNAKRCKIHIIVGSSPLSFIFGPLEAFVIINGKETKMIKFSNRLIQQVMQLTGSTRLAEESGEPTIRILGETHIIDLEDRIKTIIPGFDWESEDVLFWGTVESTSGVFRSTSPCDCLITESRFLIGTNDGRIWARSLKFISSAKYSRNKTTLTFRAVEGTEQLTIKSRAYGKVISNLISLLQKLG